ncbi:tetratricopeptide repeat protein [Sorangium sp. So ce362]|uniref:tetratricopeptide repeat protein n=1 Tax=Sorangium sp. So ce362 TaxID=3133303 RepID=UPI003F60CF05
MRLDELYALARNALDRLDLDGCVDSCDQALGQIRQPDTSTADSHLEFIYLLLLAHDILDGGSTPILDGKYTQEDLFAWADALPARADRIDTLVKLKILKGNWLSRTKSAIDAIQAMGEALALAQTGCGPLVLALATAELGHKTMKVNLRRGAELARAACDMVSPCAPQDVMSMESRRHASTIHAIRGICEFDLGYYDTSIDYLNRAHRESVSLGLRGDIAVASNYLAQLYVALGDFESAESVLVSAIERFRQGGALHAWNANNRALLGKLYLEWDKIDAAHEHLISGWRESNVVRSLPLITLVRNYHAEFLMLRAKSKVERDLLLAEELLRENIEECHRTGIYRSQILSLSLLGQLSLARGDNAQAIRSSEAAVEMLMGMGWLPALRAQEVYYNHHVVQARHGDLEQAARWLGTAYDTVLDIASRINDEARRRSFLGRVRINETIVRERTQATSLAIASR